MAFTQQYNQFQYNVSTSEDIISPNGIVSTTTIEVTK